MRFTLYGTPGWGSVLVEAQLAWHGLDHEVVEVGDLFSDPEAQAKARAHNPLGQIPALVLPDGQTMTESAAITLHLADLTGDDSLVPGPAEPGRAAFLRWLVYCVANIYPTFTYADLPERFAPEDAAQAFGDNVKDYAKRLFVILDQAAGAPFFLGERMSALDIYVCAMTRWRPGRAWHADNCPRLAAIAERMDREPRLKAVWARNFPDG